MSKNTTGRENIPKTASELICQSPISPSYDFLHISKIKKSPFTCPLIKRYRVCTFSVFYKKKGSGRSKLDSILSFDVQCSEQFKHLDLVVLFGFGENMKFSWSKITLWKFYSGQTWISCKKHFNMQ